MLKFNPIMTELTTAATDLLLGLLALGLLVALRQLRSDDPKKKYWTALFGFLTGASILGAVAHGLAVSRALNSLLWYPLYFCLAGVIAFFLIGSLHEWRGKELSSKVSPGILVAAFIVYLLFAVPDIFLIFIIYEAMGLLFCLGVYFHLFMCFKRPSALLMIIGILMTMSAAIAQALGPFQWRLIWEFDHNGLFHIIQIPGILLIFSAVRGSLKDEQKRYSTP